MSNSRGSGGVQSIPPTSRKMVLSLKEIVNCPEWEIYATLKECHMDPNEAVNRLLSQDVGVNTKTAARIYCAMTDKKGSAAFHWLYHKCGFCGSYNTRVIKVDRNPECVN